MTIRNVCLMTVATLTRRDLCHVHHHPLLPKTSMTMKLMYHSCNISFPSLTLTRPIYLIHLNVLKTHWNILISRSGKLMCCQNIFLSKLIFFKFFSEPVVPAPCLATLLTGFRTTLITLWNTCGVGTPFNSRRIIHQDKLQHLQNNCFQTGMTSGHVFWWCQKKSVRIFLFVG